MRLWQTAAVVLLATPLACASPRLFTLEETYVEGPSLLVDVDLGSLRSGLSAPRNAVLDHALAIALPMIAPQDLRHVALSAVVPASDSELRTFALSINVAQPVRKAAIDKSVAQVADATRAQRGDLQLIDYTIADIAPLWPADMLPKQLTFATPLKVTLLYQEGASLIIWGPTPVIHSMAQRITAQQPPQKLAQMDVLRGAVSGENDVIVRYASPTDSNQAVKDALTPTHFVWALQNTSVARVSGILHFANRTAATQFEAQARTLRDDVSRALRGMDRGFAPLESMALTRAEDSVTLEARLVPTDVDTAAHWAQAYALSAKACTAPCPMGREALIAIVSGKQRAPLQDQALSLDDATFDDANLIINVAGINQGALCVAPHHTPIAQLVSAQSYVGSVGRKGCNADGIREIVLTSVVQPAAPQEWLTAAAGGHVPLSPWFCEAVRQDVPLRGADVEADIRRFNAGKADAAQVHVQHMGNLSVADYRLPPRPPTKSTAPPADLPWPEVDAVSMAWQDGSTVYLLGPAPAIHHIVERTVGRRLPHLLANMATLQPKLPVNADVTVRVSYPRKPADMPPGPAFLGLAASLTHVGRDLVIQGVLQHDTPDAARTFVDIASRLRSAIPKLLKKTTAARQTTVTQDGNFVVAQVTITDRDQRIIKAWLATTKAQACPGPGCVKPSKRRHR